MPHTPMTPVLEQLASGLRLQGRNFKWLAPEGQPFQWIELRLPEGFEDQPLNVRLLPLDTVSPPDDHDPDVDLLLDLLRMDARLPMPWQPEGLALDLACLEVINAILPLGAVVPVWSEQAWNWQHTHASPALQPNAAVLGQILDTLAFYMPLLLGVWTEARRQQLAPADVGTFLAAMVGLPPSAEDAKVQP